MTPRWLAILGSAAFFGVLQAGYPLLGARIYGITTFSYVDLPDWMVLLTWVVALAPSFWLPTKITRPSQTCYWFLYLVVLMPTIFIPFHTMAGRAGQIAPFVLMVWLSFVLLGAVYLLPLGRIPRPKLGGWFFVGVCVLCIALIVALALGTGLKLDLNLATVYQRRSEAREIAGARSGNLYISSTLGNSIAPFLFAVGLAYRKWFLVVLSLIGLAAVFSLTGLKSVFFTPVLMAAIYPAIAKAPNLLGGFLTFASASMGGL